MPGFISYVRLTFKIFILLCPEIPAGKGKSPGSEEINIWTYQEMCWSTSSLGPGLWVIFEFFILLLSILCIQEKLFLILFVISCLYEPTAEFLHSYVKFMVGFQCCPYCKCPVEMNLSHYYMGRYFCSLFQNNFHCYLFHVFKRVKIERLLNKINMLWSKLHFFSLARLTEQCNYC